MNIILIGFMGSGKTTTGLKLAKKFRYNFIDMDQKICKSANKTVNEIFNKFGEGHFRRVESSELAKLKSVKNSVISTGGGIILNPENLTMMKELGVIVYLSVSPEEIFKRIGNDKNRPLLNKKNKELEIKKLLDSRIPIYEQESNIQINTNSKRVDDIVNIITHRIKAEYADC